MLGNGASWSRQVCSGQGQKLCLRGQSAVRTRSRFDICQTEQITQTYRVRCHHISTSYGMKCTQNNNKIHPLMQHSMLMQRKISWVFFNPVHVYWMSVVVQAIWRQYFTTSSPRMDRRGKSLGLNTSLSWLIGVRRISDKMDWERPLTKDVSLSSMEMAEKVRATII